MQVKTILLVEDDANISKLVKYNLEKSGFQCISCITGEDGLDYLEDNSADLVILDVMLPKMDGFEVCKVLKQDGKLKNIPVMMLTAKGEEIDRIIGFELGADDYLVKPFSPRELILRIKAILKRSGSVQAAAPEGELFSFKDLKIDTSKHKVMINKKSIDLTPMEFKLLLTLVKRNGRVQSRERLLDDVWNMDSEVTTRTIDTHVKRLRQKLGKMGRFVETVRGIGYRFSEEE